MSTYEWNINASGTTYMNNLPAKTLLGAQRAARSEALSQSPWGNSCTAYVVERCDNGEAYRWESSTGSARGSKTKWTKWEVVERLA